MERAQAPHKTSGAARSENAVWLQHIARGQNSIGADTQYIMYALNRLQATSGTWYWVVSFSRAGKMRSQRFYDPMYGGSAKAKKAAVAWRDEQLTQTPALSLVQFCQQKRSNNVSGVPGVHFLTSARQPEGLWQAKLKIAGKARTKSFSVREHGDRRAYEMAVAARQALLAEAQDRAYLYDPLARRKAPPLVAA